MRRRSRFAILGGMLLAAAGLYEGITGRAVVADLQVGAAGRDVVASLQAGAAGRDVVAGLQAGAAGAGAQPSAATGVTIYEGARLITGDGSAPIESSAFVVDRNRFVEVGRRGAIRTPPGATRVDLTGKTVIPALVDAHSHIGYMKDLTSGAANYTRDNILDHMRRFAYFGVGASQAMGSDFGELPFEIRDDILTGRHPDAARFLTAGRGLAPLDEISADNMRQARSSTKRTGTICASPSTPPICSRPSSCSAPASTSSPT